MPEQYFAGRTGLAGTQDAKKNCPTKSLPCPPDAAEVPAWASYLITTHSPYAPTGGKDKFSFAAFHSTGNEKKNRNKAECSGLPFFSVEKGLYSRRAT